MPSTLPQFNFRLTQSQKELLEEAIQKSGLNKNEYMRRLLARHIPGFDHAQIVPRRGTYRRKKS